MRLISTWQAAAIYRVRAVLPLGWNRGFRASCHGAACRYGNSSDLSFQIFPECLLFKFYCEQRVGRVLLDGR